MMMPLTPQEVFDKVCAERMPPLTERQKKEIYDDAVNAGNKASEGFNKRIPPLTQKDIEIIYKEFFDNGYQNYW